MPSLTKIKESMVQLNTAPEIMARMDIASSPLNTNGEKPCSFVFEILQ